MLLLMERGRPRRRSAVHSSGYQFLLRRLRDARAAAGMTQVQVAKALGRQQSYAHRSAAVRQAIPQTTVLLPPTGHRRLTALGLGAPPGLSVAPRLCLAGRAAAPVLDDVFEPAEGAPLAKPGATWIIAHEPL